MSTVLGDAETHNVQGLNAFSPPTSASRCYRELIRHIIARVEPTRNSDASIRHTSSSCLKTNLLSNAKRQLQFYWIESLHKIASPFKPQPCWHPRGLWVLTRCPLRPRALRGKFDLACASEKLRPHRLFSLCPSQLWTLTVDPKRLAPVGAEVDRQILTSNS